MASLTSGVVPSGSGAWRWVAGTAAAVFGLATVLEGGRLLLGGEAARAEVGDVVLFVLGFNFAAGLGYVAAGAGILARRRWSIGLARLLAVSTVAVAAVFAVYVLRGGPHLGRTVVAMGLRSGFWIALALALPRLLGEARHG